MQHRALPSLGSEGSAVQQVVAVPPGSKVLAQLCARPQTPVCLCVPNPWSEPGTAALHPHNPVL